MESISKIIYWYDKNIKLYTFLILDEEGNHIENAYYCGKSKLLKTKDYYEKLYNIKPIKGR